MTEQLAVEVAIIGGGFSGAMLALHLVERGVTGIAVIDPRERVGLGRAYGTSDPSHLLNVPAAKMSAFPDRPEHFLRWLETQPEGAPKGPAGFAPRQIYGRYVSGLFAALPPSTCRHVRDEVAGLRPNASGALLKLASGHTVQAARVVLALGNFPAAPPGRRDDPFFQSPAYIADPWAPGALARIAPSDEVLLVGSGLTAFDIALSLIRQGHRGRLHLVSRRGQLPQSHRAEALFASYAWPEELPRALGPLMRHIRRGIAEAAARGVDWRVPFDALRPRLQRLWAGLTPAEKARFLRHLRPFWEAHRHRAPAEVAAEIESLAREGRLRSHAARVLGYEATPDGVRVRLRPRHTSEVATLCVGWVINCTGPQSDFRVLQSPLIADLRAQGLIQPDTLGLGLETDPRGALIARDGTASEVLFTIGTARKPALWETTAVPELRGQTVALAETLAKSIDRASAGSLPG